MKLCKMLAVENILFFKIYYIYLKGRDRTLPSAGSLIPYIGVMIETLSGSLALVTGSPVICQAH